VSKIVLYTHTHTHTQVQEITPPNHCNRPECAVQILTSTSQNVVCLAISQFKLSQNRTIKSLECVAIQTSKFSHAFKPCIKVGW
jgi:hypothetical protein